MKSLTSCKKIVLGAKKVKFYKMLVDSKRKIRRFSSMKKLNDVALKLLAKAAYANAEKEANSACLFIGYQPKMPQKVKELKERK